jgi:hypothetical protein
MGFDSTETRLAPQIFVIKLRNKKFLGRAASDTDLRCDDEKETSSLEQDADIIIEIILISGCPQDEIAIAYFLCANAFVQLSLRGVLPC